MTLGKNLESGEQGELKRYAERNVWGDLKIGVHGNSDLARFEDSFRFSSYGYDSVIGKHFAYARFYDSSQGRMLAKDPIKRGLNPYLYCDNDPVDYVDPVGETPTILAGGVLGLVTGGVFGFAGSAVSQLVSGEEFSLRKALGSAVNGAVVGAVQGSLVGSGVGIPAAFAANFGAGAVGNALEQGISKGSVDIRESITSGLTNAVSGAIYGNAPLKSFKSAFFRGSAAGGATAAINNISNAIGSMYTDDEESFGYSDGISANGATSNGRRRNPRTLCGGINPFEKSLGYQTAYGYHYSAGHSSSSTRTTRKKKGFSLGEFAKDVAVGTMTGGLASVAFHGLGKAVEALTGSVGRSSDISTYNKYDLYRKNANTGDFKELNELMQLKNVKNVANDAGIGLDGVRIKIDRNAELLGKGVYGFTDGKTITLYPDAFADTETLVKTLGHERIHVYQVSILGKPTSTDILKEFEVGAFASEKGWWDYYKFKNGGK